MINSRRPTALATLSFLLVQLWSPLGPISRAGAAETTPTAAVVGFRNADSLSERQARLYFSERLKDSRRMIVLPDDVVSKQTETTADTEYIEASESVEKARENFLSGRKLYDGLKIDEAITAFNAAVRGYRQGIGALKENRYLLAAHLYLGMALMVRGRTAEGREYLRQMIILNPARKDSRLPESEFPPKIVSAHTEITQEVMAGPKGEVSIGTSPRDAIVYFDGVKLPSPNSQLKDVPVGEHFVVAEKKGFRRFATRIVVAPGSNRVEVNLDSWQPLGPYVGFDQRRDLKSNDLLLKVGEKLGAQILVLGQVDDLGNDQLALSAQLYDTRSKEFTRVERVEAERGKIKRSATDLADQILRNLAVGGYVVVQTVPEKLGGETVVDRRDESRTYRPRDDHSPFYKTWWFWTIVGVAAGGAGAFVALRSQSSADYNILSVDNPFLP